MIQDVSKFVNTRIVYELKELRESYQNHQPRTPLHKNTLRTHQNTLKFTKLERPDPKNIEM